MVIIHKQWWQGHLEGRMQGALSNGPRQAMA